MPLRLPRRELERIFGIELTGAPTSAGRRPGITKRDFDRRRRHDRAWRDRARARATA